MGRPLPVRDLGWAIKDPYEFGSPWSDLTPRLVARLHTSWDVAGRAADWLRHWTLEWRESLWPLQTCEDEVEAD